MEVLTIVWFDSNCKDKDNSWNSKIKPRNLKEKFSEIKDALSKEKVIKSTLELMIYTNCEEILALDDVESSDWFLVSSVTKDKQNSDILGSFQIDGKEFEVYKATAHKCPRCWKFTAVEEETLCNRCEEVLK